jgi:hypothetical protein
MNQKSAHRALLVCPLALFALSIITTNLQGPFYFGNNSDPEYQYLLNGLNVATLQLPGKYDHPGTTLVVIEGAIILSKWAVGSCLFGPWQSLQDAVLLNPEDYLHTIGLILNLLLSAAIYIAARRIYRLSESLLTALVFQIGFGMFMEPFRALARVSPEPLLAIAVVILTLPISGMVFRRYDKPSETDERLAVATGFALAFGIVTKITFAPLLAVCLLFRTKRSLFICLASCFAGTSALLFPIWTHLSEMYGWFASLLIHTERYGKGPVGFPSAATLLSHVAEIHLYEPMLVLLLAFYAASYVAIRKGWVRTPNGEAVRVGRLLLVGVVAIAVQIAITLMHFSLQYLLPAMVFTMLLNAALIFLFSRAEPGKVSRGLYAAMVLLLVLGMWHSYRWLAILKTLSNQYRADVSSILNRRREMKDCTVIPYYRSSSQEFALSFGYDGNGGVNGRELAELYPKAIHYNIWAHQFYSMNAEPRWLEIRRALAGGACYVMQGEPPSKADLEALSGFTLTPILIAGDEGLYRLGRDATGDHLALGKAATQSSTLVTGSAASLAVDGNTNGSFSGGFVTHTNLEANPWWQVDLGASTAIHSIVIWNRTDCCQDRLADYWVFVSDVPFRPKDTPSTLQSRPGTWSSHQTTAPNPSATIRTGGIKGRYVRVQLTGTNRLSLAEVQVF